MKELFRHIFKKKQKIHTIKFECEFVPFAYVDDNQIINQYTALILSDLSKYAMSTTYVHYKSKVTTSKLKSFYKEDKQY